MQCESCGTELPGDATHCPVCGIRRSDRVSNFGVLPDEPTTASAPYSAVSQPQASYGSIPYEPLPNPYEQNPYRPTLSVPHLPPRRRRINTGLAIGIVALVLIVVSGSISLFVWFSQSTTSQAQNVTTNKITVAETTPINKVTVAEITPTNTVTATETAPTVGKFDTSFYYRFTNDYLGRGQALAVKSDGSYHLTMVPVGNASTQNWQLVDLGAGKYALRVASLGKAFSLDVINDGTNNTLWMAATGNYTGQYWTVTSWGDGTYKFTNDFTGSGELLDTYSDTHDAFLEPPDHTGQHWTLTQLTKIPA